MYFISEHSQPWRPHYLSSLFLVSVLVPVFLLLPFLVSKNHRFLRKSKSPYKYLLQIPHWKCKVDIYKPETL